MKWERVSFPTFYPFNIIFFIFRMNFRMDFSFCKTVIRILIWISLNLKIILGVINIFATLSISIHEHEISFQLFLFSLIPFNNGFYLTVFKSFSWLSIFPSNFLFYAILNGIVFFNFWMGHCLRLEKKALLNLLISSKVWMECLGFYTYRVTTSAIRENFTSFFLFLD